MKNSTQKILFGLAGKIGIISLMAICFAVFNLNTKAQTLIVNYDFASAVAGTPCTATPLMTATNVTSMFTTGGTDGETCTLSVGNGTNQPTGFAFAENERADLAVSVSSSKVDAVNYFQFQLTGVSAFRSYKLFFQPMQSGPIDVQYSLDGINFTSFIQFPLPRTKIAFPNREVDLSSVSALDGQPTVYFRLEGKSSPNRILRFIIDNFQVQAMSANKSRKRVRVF